jgi:hypothetical protein
MLKSDERPADKRAFRFGATLPSISPDHEAKAETGRAEPMTKAVTEV